MTKEKLVKKPWYRFLVVAYALFFMGFLGAIFYDYIVNFGRKPLGDFSSVSLSDLLILFAVAWFVKKTFFYVLTGEPFFETEKDQLMRLIREEQEVSSKK